MLRSSPLLAAALAVALLTAGCQRLFDQGARDDIQEGDKKLRAGDARGAIPLYEAALDGTPKSADVHYRLALLYANNLKSPVDALHHFKRYLTLAPNGPHAKEADEYQTMGVQKIIAEFTKGNAITQAEAIRLKTENQRLQDSLAKTQKELQQANALAGANRGAESKRRPIPAGGRTYTVQNGDNFAKIAMKFYNTRTKAQKIQDANFFPQQGTPIIRVGDVLYIP